MKKLNLTLIMLLSFALLTACVGSKSPAPKPAPKPATSSVDTFTKAAGSGNTQAVRDYLARGGDVNAKDRNGSNALLEAAYYDQSGLVTYLLSKGAQIDVKNKDGRTPLMLSGKEVPVLDHYSNRTKSLNTMKILIKAGANLNARANDGQTAIVYSIWANREVMGGKGYAISAVELLLEAGADPNIKDNNGDSALVLANLYNMKYVVDELNKYGAK